MRKVANLNLDPQEARTSPPLQEDTDAPRGKVDTGNE